MATLLTINTTPEVINPAYSPIIWNATSTNVNIKAVRADVYINGVYSSTINGVRTLGTTNEFNFDVRKIMQSDLISELRTNVTIFKISDATVSAKTIKVRLFEIIEAGGVFTSTWAADGAGTNYLESSTVDVVNMATQHQETLADWTVDTSAKKLLTMSLTNKRIPRNVPFQVGFLGADANYIAQIETFDVDGVSLGTASTGLPVSVTSKKGIITIPASSFSSSTIKFLEVKLQEGGGATRSITYRYKIVDVCDPFVLFFQNHLGDFEHFDFGVKVSKKISTTNQRMEKPLPTVFTSIDAGLITISSKTKTKIEVQTGALTADELIFLQELIKNHTVVYKWDSAGVFISYVVTSHSTKVEDNDDLINYIKITLQPSNEHIVQNGN